MNIVTGIAIYSIFPLIAFILLDPPIGRIAHTIWASMFGGLASWLIVIAFGYDTVIRITQSQKKNIDLISGNNTQIIVVIIAMIAGGIAANLFVTGLSKPWRIKTPKGKDHDEFLMYLLDMQFETIKDRSKLLPDSRKLEYIQKERKNHEVMDIIMKLENMELADVIIQKYNELEKDTITSIKSC